MSETNEPYERFFIESRRAVLPRVLFADDVAAVLQMKPRSAIKALSAGRCGRTIRVGRRLAVLRETFLAHLSQQQAAAREPHLPSPASSDTAATAPAPRN